jgi:hypothetical protein
MTWPTPEKQAAWEQEFFQRQLREQVDKILGAQTAVLTRLKIHNTTRLQPERIDALLRARRLKPTDRRRAQLLAAHSSLEELGLELRASAQRPSRIDGRWNPIVKEDLERRLTAARVDLTQPVLWTIRGSGKRRLDAKRTVTTRSKYSWARGWIRDAPVEVVDAIAHVD